MAILAVLIFLLTSTGGAFQQYVTLRTYMDDASGMATTAPVRLNGILVGIRGRDPALRLQGSEPHGGVRPANPETGDPANIPEDSVAAITAANLLGDKFINITRGKSPQHAQAGGELQGLAAQDIPELMAQSANVLQTLQNIVGRVDTMLAGVEKGQGNIGKLLKDEELYQRLNGIASEGQKLVADIRTGKGTLSKLLYDDTLYQEVRAPIKRLDAMLADLQRGQGTAGKLLQRSRAVRRSASAPWRRSTQLVADLNAGKGTAGKLLKDEQLYERLNVLVAQLEHHHRQDQLRPGHDRAADGQPAALRVAQRRRRASSRRWCKDIRANPKKFLSIKLSLF